MYQIQLNGKDMNEPIIKSILDNDLYKFSMQLGVMKKFPHAKVKYTFINRGETKFPEGFAEELRKQVKMMGKLRLTIEEKKWLSAKCNYFDPIYLDYLEGYKFNSTEVGIIQKNEDLEISIEGLWAKTILWEVPLMALISELYFKMSQQKPYDVIKRDDLNSKKKALLKFNTVHYADFGTRRRFSYEIQDEVVKNFGDKFNKEHFVGTSNVHLAMKYNVKPIGTHAHEWFMFHAAKYGYKIANYLAMENWSDVFKGDLGIALPDTFTTSVFLKLFDKKFAKLYDGVRQDSGDPKVFADLIIEHYKKLNIDPITKVIIFSDNLNPEKAIELKEYCRGKIKCSFGIGTNFSNDVGVKPLNMVIKMISAKSEGEEWQHCIKLSDSEGKYTGDKKEIEVAKYTLNLK
jgi:nicotinate phosphoribosyltransferase